MHPCFLTASFLFCLPPLLLLFHPTFTSLTDDDDESVPDDVDDRCESDISGIAGDESDLSSMMYNIADLPLIPGPRMYKHRPNNNLNTFLTTVALMVFFVAIGIGIGHYLGKCLHSENCICKVND